MLPSEAQQVNFSRTDTETGITLSYQWIDHFGQTQNIAFTLPSQAVNSLHRGVKNYMPDIAQRYVYIELMKAARNVNPREARIHLRKIGSDTKITVSGRTPELAQKWQQVMQDSKDASFRQYLEENYYTQFYTKFGKRAIRPDHIRY